MATKLTLRFSAPNVYPYVEFIEIEPEAEVGELRDIMVAKYPSLGEPGKLCLFKVGCLSPVTIYDRYHTIPCR
jgi:hypothetical protein